MNDSKKRYFRFCTLFLIYLFPLSMVAQEKAKDLAPATTRAQRKAAQKKWKQFRNDERDQKKAVREYHKRIQTKQTIKMMRQERQKGEKMRINKREFILVRWIKSRKL